MSIKNPIQFTSKTFTTILNDINSDSELIDKPNWFKRIWAGVGDIISMWINALGNNLVLRTAYTRQNVADLLELIDYYLAPQETSQGQILFYLKKSSIFPLTFTVNDLKAQTIGSSNISSKKFEPRAGITVVATSETVNFSAVNITTDIITVSRVYTTGEKILLIGGDLPIPLAIDTEYWIIKISDTEIQLALTLLEAYTGTNINITTTGSGNFDINLYSVSVESYQQESQDSSIIGTSDGITEWLEYSLNKENILKDTIEIEINGDIWDLVDTLVDSISTDKHYEIIYTISNIAKIRFGNGIYGAIPPAFDINAIFAIGGGDTSNISTYNKITVYSGSNSNIVAVSNPFSLSGGSDIESIPTGKRLGPLLLKARNRYITTEDGIALIEKYGGVAQSHINENKYGVLSSQVVIVPTGGGTSSTQFKTDLQQYLIDRTVLESIDVRIFDATYLTQNVTSIIKISDGYIYSDVEPFVDLGFKLFFSEVGLQIVRNLESDGISDTVTLINNTFSTSFLSDSYTQIQRLVENLIPREINVDIQESDILGYIDSFVNGVDYLTISTPSFPIILGEEEITTNGTISITEII